jgi:CHAD domain-containing protein
VIKIKNEEIMSCLDGLNAIAKTKVKASTSFKIILINDKIKEIEKTFKKVIVDLQTKYAKKDETNRVVTTDEDKIIWNSIEDENTFIKEYNELSNSDNELNIFPLKISDFTDGQGKEIEIEPKVIYLLKPIIELT